MSASDRGGIRGLTTAARPPTHAVCPNAAWVARPRRKRSSSRRPIRQRSVRIRIRINAPTDNTWPRSWSRARHPQRGDLDPTFGGDGVGDATGFTVPLNAERHRHRVRAGREARRRRLRRRHARRRRPLQPQRLARYHVRRRRQSDPPRARRRPRHRRRRRPARRQGPRLQRAIPHAPQLRRQPRHELRLRRDHRPHPLQLGLRPTAPPARRQDPRRRVHRRERGDHSGRLKRLPGQYVLHRLHRDGAERERGAERPGARRPTGRSSPPSPPTPAAPISARFVARFNANGTADTTFDDDGVVQLAPGPKGSAYAVQAQDGGKVAVAGTVTGGFFFGRLRADGRTDPSYGTDGYVVRPDPVVVDPASSSAAFQEMEFAPDGKVLAAGPARSGPAPVPASSSAGTWPMARSTRPSARPARPAPRWGPTRAPPTWKSRPTGPSPSPSAAPRPARGSSPRRASRPPDSPTPPSTAARSRPPSRSRSATPT